jgi:hypothetical protein
MIDVPAPQMIFWKLGDWKCEYWRTNNQRRLIVFYRDEPLIDQPCTDAESVVRRSREYRRLVETATQGAELS